MANGEWDLIGTRLVRNVVYYPCCFEPFPDVTITIVIRRKILYYMYNVILPCLMMSTLTLLVFCLPPESGEKISLGVTVLLAFSVFMLAVSEKLPETSESIPLLGKLNISPIYHIYQFATTENLQHWENFSESQKSKHATRQSAEMSGRK